jgi:hypothetical protein
MHELQSAHPLAGWAVTDPVIGTSGSRPSGVGYHPGAQRAALAEFGLGPNPPDGRENPMGPASRQKKSSRWPKLRGSSPQAIFTAP